jgi:hypothetical protein
MRGGSLGMWERLWKMTACGQFGSSGRVVCGCSFWVRLGLDTLLAILRCM